MVFWYPDRKFWTLASGKLDQNIYSFALELEIIIESALIEGERMTAVLAMITSRSRIVPPAKNNFMDNRKGYQLLDTEISSSWSCFDFIVGIHQVGMSYKINLKNVVSQRLATI